MSELRRAFLTVLVVLCVTGAGISTADATTELRRGDVGGDVLLWQRMLNYMTMGEHHLPEDVIAEDGIFGPKTEVATKRSSAELGFEEMGSLEYESGEDGWGHSSPVVEPRNRRSLSVPMASMWGTHN